MVLRNYERALQRNLLSFTNFLLLLLSLRKRERERETERDRDRDRHRKTETGRDRERQRERQREYFGAFDQKRFHFLTIFFLILEYLHQTILSFNVTIQCFKVMRFCCIYPGNHKKLF